MANYWAPTCTTPTPAHQSGASAVFPLRPPIRRETGLLPPNRDRNPVPEKRMARGNPRGGSEEKVPGENLDGGGKKKNQKKKTPPPCGAGGGGGKAPGICGGP